MIKLGHTYHAEGLTGSVLHGCHSFPIGVGILLMNRGEGGAYPCKHTLFRRHAEELDP